MPRDSAPELHQTRVTQQEALKLCRHLPFGIATLQMVARHTDVKVMDVVVLNAIGEDLAKGARSPRLKGNPESQAEIGQGSGILATALRLAHLLTPTPDRSHVQFTPAYLPVL